MSKHKNNAPGFVVSPAKNCGNCQHRDYGHVRHWQPSDLQFSSKVYESEFCDAHEFDFIPGEHAPGNYADCEPGDSKCDDWLGFDKVNDE